MTKFLILNFAWILALSSGVRAETFSMEGLDIDSLATLPPTHLRLQNIEVSGVEATNLRVADSTTYVTYNSAGATSRGAFEAVDISDVRNPRALSLLVYSDTEFADVALDGDFAYLVGQINSPAHQGAVLKKIDISDPNHLVDLGNVFINGYAATSIHVRNGEAIVAIGDNLGVKTFDLSDDALPKPVHEIPLPNALYAVSSHDSYLALGGATQTSLYAYRKSDFSPLASVSISRKTSASPARFQVKGDFGYINDETAGLSIVDLSRLGEGTLSLSSQLAIPGTGNGLDVHHGFVFLAQGEAGLYVVNAESKNKPRILGNLDFHHTGESTNQVREISRFEWWPFGFHHYLLVANGSGGLRTFELRRH